MIFLFYRLEFQQILKKENERQNALTAMVQNCGGSTQNGNETANVLVTCLLNERIK